MLKFRRAWSATNTINKSQYTIGYPIHMDRQAEISVKAVIDNRLSNNLCIF